jgi:ATP phosphoribosyltransferase regulatory subunit
VLAIAAECLERAGATEWVLALGHVGIFNGLVEGAGFSPARVELLRERVEAKDAAGVREALSGSDLRPATAEAIERLTSLAGGPEVVLEAERSFSSSPTATAALAELRAVIAALDEAGIGDHVAVDLGEVRGLDYYTGLVFRVYAPGLGFEVGGGGRYDGLLGRFGRPLPAVGFMLGLDRLAVLLERQGQSDASPPAPAEAVSGRALGPALRLARERRSQGARVRFGNGEAR